MDEAELSSSIYPSLSSMLSNEDVADPGLMREIYPNLSIPDTSRSLVINTGASHGTLQDIKLPEYSGGYTFSAGGARRCLFWRVSGDTLDLVEESTDVDIEHGRLRLQFPDSPILEGMSAHETGSALVLLLATVSSVHRLRLALPGRAGRSAPPATRAPSLLTQLSTSQLRLPDSMHVLPGLANAPPAHTAASCLLADGQAVYLLAGPVGGGTVVRYLQSGPGPLVSTHQLQPAGVVGRLWGMLGGDESQLSVDAAVALPAPGPAAAVAAVCRDGRLRLWPLLERAPPLLERDLLTLAAERRGGGGAPAAGARKHGLRQLATAATGPRLLAAHLCLPQLQVFVLLRAELVRGSWQAEHVVTISAPDHDLVDFSLTSEALWALWSTAEAESRVGYCPLSEGGAAGWREVALVAPPPGVHVTAGSHLSSAYLRHIFHPGRFQTSTIQRAVAISTRRECTASGRALRTAAVAAVEAAIQQAAPDYQLSAAEFQTLALDAWEAFYSACLQYHQVATKPVGLSAAAGSDQVALVRQSLVSYLRPADLLERLWLSETLQPEDLAEEPHPTLSPVAKCDVARLVRCCRLLESHIGPELAAALRQDLTHLQPPEAIARTVVSTVFEGDEAAGLRDELTARVAAVSDLTAALSTLLALLQVDGTELSAAADGGGGDSFSSRLGEGLLSACVEQQVTTRYRLARDLLLLETLLLTVADRCRLSGDQQTAIRAQFVPETVIQVQAYFYLLWLVEEPAEPVSADRQEAALRQLAALSMTDVTPPPPLPVGPQTLLQLFVGGEGGWAARTACPGTGTGTAAAQPWRRTLPALTAAVTRLVWPVRRRAALPELLLARCQYSALRECVRLQQSWCDWNSPARSLLLGLALLNLRQPDKACDVLVNSAIAVSRETDLLARVLHLEPEPEQPDEEPEAAACRQLVRYHLRLVQLLELYQLSDWVLELATAGISIAAEDDPHLPTLWSVVFKYHLKLGHVTEAYTAMTDNPELSRRRDCLRQLVVTLHERRDIATLVSLSYVDMLHDVVAILEDRARASDPLHWRYYDILYAFHVIRSNYRKAATAMYECSRRLAAMPEGLSRQADCLLACVNQLQLLSAEYAWIVRPAAAGDPAVQGREGADTPRVSVVTLEEVRREAALVSARLRLQENGDEAAGVGSGAPTEVVARLVAARLYSDAVQISGDHQLGLEPVVRALAAELAAAGEEVAGWPRQGRTQPAAGGQPAGSLLRRLLESAPAGDTRLLRAAAGRLLQLGAPLPAWLTVLYQRRSAAELCRLLLRAGQLEPAGRLLLTLMEALLGSGTQLFGLENAVHATCPPVWFPYTQLDQVLAELRTRSETPAYGALLRSLTETLTRYQQTLQRVSGDMAAVR